jgi:hypothetical protein
MMASQSTEVNGDTISPHHYNSRMVYFRRLLLNLEVEAVALLNGNPSSGNGSEENCFPTAFQYGQREAALRDELVQSLRNQIRLLSQDLARFQETEKLLRNQLIISDKQVKQLQNQVKVLTLRCNEFSTHETKKEVEGAAQPLSSTFRPNPPELTPETPG